jgi:CRP-like cAMP-binding protein
MLGSLEMRTDEDRAALENDEHPIVRETGAASELIASGGLAPPSTLEKMIPLASIGIFSGLEPEDLGQLARAVTESWLTRGQILCREGDYGDEVFVVLAGEVSIQRREGGISRTVESAAAGACIGELEVLDPAPRVATVVVSTAAARLLRMSGSAFREALSASPTVSEGIIRLLARRLRGQAPSGNAD